MAGPPNVLVFIDDEYEREETMVILRALGLNPLYDPSWLKWLHLLEWSQVELIIIAYDLYEQTGLGLLRVLRDNPLSAHIDDERPVILLGGTLSDSMNKDVERRGRARFLLREDLSLREVLPDLVLDLLLFRRAERSA